jgi:hydrogenase/urease accessory protein HupE
VRGAVFLLVFLFAWPARAHQASVTYSHLVVDGAEVRYRLDLASTDLYEALGLDRDRDASDEEIRAGGDKLFAYVSARLRLADGETPCPLASRGVTVIQQTSRFARIELAATCPAAIRRLVVDYQLFFDLDASHVAMIEVRHAAEVVRRELSREASRLEWDLAAAAPASMGFVDYLASGVEHIFTGYDHICFVLALLLAAAASRPRESVLAVLRLVTAFTVAHSITLIVAALGWLELPGRLVESTIAASIVYVAVENLVATPRHRLVLVFAFGLVHGLGFASLLRPLLPAGDVIVPLLAFNLGVELGQLAIVSLVLPVLLVAARRPSYARVRNTLSLLIALFGLLWLVDRVFEVSTISRYI